MPVSFDIADLQKVLCNFIKIVRKINLNGKNEIFAIFHLKSFTLLIIFSFQLLRNYCVFSALSFASSSRDFDPRSRPFSDEELKPQPMVKKSRKQVRYPCLPYFSILIDKLHLNKISEIFTLEKC